MHLLLYLDFMANDLLERFVQVHIQLTRLIIRRLTLVQLLTFLDLTSTKLELIE